MANTVDVSVNRVNVMLDGVVNFAIRNYVTLDAMNMVNVRMVHAYV